MRVLVTANVALLEAATLARWDEDGTVRIGEAPNIVTLGRAEWNELVRAVKSGTLGDA